MLNKRNGNSSGDWVARVGPRIIVVPGIRGGRWGRDEVYTWPRDISKPEACRCKYVKIKLQRRFLQHVLERQSQEMRGQATD